jgi:hypothetical protein
MEKQSINLSSVVFPALIIADDGWVDLWYEQQTLSASAVATYSNQRIVIYDTQNQAWLVERIIPVKKVSLLDRMVNRKLQVEMEVKQITTDAFAAILDVLDKAIDAGNELFTQQMEAVNLKKAIQGAGSFEVLLETLRLAGAIYK